MLSKHISFSFLRVSPFQLTFSGSVNWIKQPLVTHHSKVIVRNKAWSQNPWLFSSENSCLGSASIVHYYTSAWGLICLQDSHECFLLAKAILEKAQFHIPVLLAVSVMCPVVVLPPEVTLHFERLSRVDIKTSLKLSASFFKILFWGNTFSFQAEGIHELDSNGSNVFIINEHFISMLLVTTFRVTGNSGGIWGCPKHSRVIPTVEWHLVMLMMEQLRITGT